MFASSAYVPELTVTDWEMGGCDTDMKIRINTVGTDFPHVTVTMGWYQLKKDEVRQLSYRQAHQS